MNDTVTLSVNCDKLIKMALAEDITGEDVSTNAIIKTRVPGSVQLICKQKGVICGLGVFERTFKLLDAATEVTGRAHGAQLFAAHERYSHLYPQRGAAA